MLSLARSRLKAFLKAGEPLTVFSCYSVLLAECTVRLHCCARYDLALPVQVLNLSSGREEIVDPENVWNCIPDRACRSSEVWQCDSGLGRAVPIFRKGCSVFSCDFSCVTRVLFSCVRE